MRERDTIAALVAAATFIVGYAVADLVGIRALGGLVLLLGGAWCAWRLYPRVGAVRTASMLAIALATFVFSHRIGDTIGAWPAVILSALIVGAATLLIS